MWRATPLCYQSSLNLVSRGETAVAKCSYRGRVDTGLPRRENTANTGESSKLDGDRRAPINLRKLDCPLRHRLNSSLCADTAFPNDALKLNAVPIHMGVSGVVDRWFLDI